MTNLLLFAVAIVLINVHCDAADKIYKWVDKNGKVHFGDASDSGAVPEPEPKRPAGQSGSRQSKPLDDQTWNRAVERAENAPTGSSARSIAGFADAPRPTPSYQQGGVTYQYSRSYQSPGQAIQQSDAERRFYEQQKQQQMAQENARRQLIAECERNRGTDCRDDQTLRYMENANKPRGASR